MAGSLTSASMDFPVDCCHRFFEDTSDLDLVVLVGKKKDRLFKFARDWITTSRVTERRLAGKLLGLATSDQDQLMAHKKCFERFTNSSKLACAVRNKVGENSFPIKTL